MTESKNILQNSIILSLFYCLYIKKKKNTCYKKL